MSLSAKNLLSSIPASELENLIDSNPSLKGVMTGYIAEQKLMTQLSATPQLTGIKKIKDHDRIRGDIEFIYNDKKFTIEVKCLRKLKNKSTGFEDVMVGGFTGTVEIGTSDRITKEDGITSTVIKKNEFSILAVCTILLNDTWDFYFIQSKYLPSDREGIDTIRRYLQINTYNMPCLYKDFNKVLQDLN